MKYTELIEASKALSEKATKGAWWKERWSRGDQCPEGVHFASILGHTELGDDFIICDLRGIPSMQYALEGGQADADLVVHAKTALPALVQGLEDALKVIEAAREVERVWGRSCSPATNALRAALAHFDARERGGAT